MPPPDDRTFRATVRHWLIDLICQVMFSFKVFSDTKVPTSSLFAYQAARNVVWANVLTRLKVAISWHINIVCVCTMAQREFCSSIHVKNHNALIIVFLEMPLPIFRTVQEKTRVWWIQNTPHCLHLRPQAKPFEGLHSVGSLWNVDEVACHDKLVLSDHLAVLKF